jgi:hypothetical protein
VQLLRGRVGLWLVATALGLAIAEQGLLYLLRAGLGIEITEGFWDNAGSQFLVLVIGVGLEAMIINLLGPQAGRAAAIAVEAGPPGGRLPWERALVTAPVAGLVTVVTSFFGPLWLLGYSLFGVSGAVIGLERRGPFQALGRGARLAFRGGMRVTWVRLLGYLSWLMLRLAFFLGLSSLIALFTLDDLAGFWVRTAGFAIVNTATYAYLAALDACALVESRFRSEAWDIWLNRAELPAAKAAKAVRAAR